MGVWYCTGLLFIYINRNPKKRNECRYYLRSSNLPNVPEPAKTPKIINTNPT